MHAQTEHNLRANGHLGYRILLSGKLAARAGLVLLALGLAASPRHLTECCVVAGGFLVTIGLGALFFILLHHVLDARWSLLAVRYMRCGLELITASVAFIVPILWHSRDALGRFSQRDAQCGHGTCNDPYYQGPFVLVRLIICYAIWVGLAYAYIDRTPIDAPPNHEDPKQARLRFFSGPALIVFALTITSFSFDWIMRLQPGWHSAVLGVYVFSGAVASALAFLALFTLARDQISTTTRGIGSSARHDIAKLLFSFVVFWAYIAFSQYLLMWYANLPSEMDFYRRRSMRGWQELTLSLVVFQFIIPFTVLLSARTKRSAPTLALAALSVVAGHYLDWYWLVLPALSPQDTTFGIAHALVLVVTALTMGTIIMRGLHHEMSLVRPEPMCGPAAE